MGKKRVNNPPVGLVTPDTDIDEKRKKYAHDPHLDPQLTWAGKAEHTSFEVPILETKGQDTARDRTKREFLDEWVRAVNSHGGFGTWSWAVSHHPKD